MSSAVAGKLITGDDIAKNAITSRNLAADSVGQSELKSGVLDGLKGEKGDTGATGTAGLGPAASADGPAGPGRQGRRSGCVNGTNGRRTASPGASYRVENYQNGACGTATLACADTRDRVPDDPTISGGEQRSESRGRPRHASDGFARFVLVPGPHGLDHAVTPKLKAVRNTPGLDGWVAKFGDAQAHRHREGLRRSPARPTHARCRRRTQRRRSTN